MCGICGQFNLRERPAPAPEVLGRMAGRLRHRGPEDSGWYADADAGLAHTRLSIIDLEAGHQPLANEDQSVWVVLNGEIFNYLELRENLLRRGHVFRTRSDTEVLVHLYEDQGPECLAALNGQFALALWDKRQRRLLLARDRFGIAPLYYFEKDGLLVFASEVKSLFAHPKAEARPDPWGLDQLYTFWATVPPRTVFQGIRELPPAHALLARQGQGAPSPRRYWDLSRPSPVANRSERVWAEELMALLLDAVRLRLRADVPVASFLSGGLDSSLISSLIKHHFNDQLETFSVRFDDPAYDEGEFQNAMAGHLRTRHHEVLCARTEIGRIMPDVVWHAEKPLIRTAPAPLFLLAQAVRRQGIKVVLTGEGADEVFGGYDLFRELKIRRFCARQPDSSARPLLFKRLYSYNPAWRGLSSRHLALYYRPTLADPERWSFSHHPRWQTADRLKQWYSPEFRESLRGSDPRAELRALLPADLGEWDPLSRAQYLEVATLLSGNLLSSQGDRMVMAHAVEARQPFLDHRLVAFGFGLPARLKIKGLNEKYLLKIAAAAYVPDRVRCRVKQPYRAPDTLSFFHDAPPDYLEELLSPACIARAGYFDPPSVAQLAAKARSGRPISGSRENQALVAMVTTMLWHRQYLEPGRHDDPPPVRPEAVMLGGAV